jgi:hypothetical protein
MFGRVILIGLVMLLGMPAWAVDGVGVGLHSDAVGKPATLMRYEIREGKVVGSRALCAEAAAAACVGPWGDRVAFLKSDGTICVVRIEGGTVAELGKAAASGLQWPASDGGEWIYYVRGEGDALLRRVHVQRKTDEGVVRFNRGVKGSFALSPDAQADFGRFVTTLDGEVLIYDLARGDGDLFNCMRVAGGGASVSPDASLLAMYDGAAGLLGLVDVTGQRQGEMRLDAAVWSDFRWSVNSVDWITATRGNDVVLLDWQNQKQVNVTANRDGASDRAVGFWETGAKRASLGYHRGEAPLTVEIADGRLHDGAAWDFGDEAKATGRSGRHTYAAEGTYTILVKDGEPTYEAQVTVLKRQAPTAIARRVNARCIAVDFDEAVRATTPTISLESGIKIDGWSLNEMGRRMTLRLASPLSGAVDRLHIAGVTDLAQEPNAVEDRAIEVAAWAWPADRAGLVFLWEDAKGLNAVWDEEAKAIRALVVGRGGGAAGIDRDGRMRLEGGRMRTGFTAQSLGSAVKANAFSLEVTVQAARVSQGASGAAAAIVSCGSGDDGAWSFLLGQEGENLVFGIRTAAGGRPTVHAIGKVADTTLPHHVCMTFSAGRWTGYVDGKELAWAEVGRLADWGDGELRFGGIGDRAWRGRVEGVAIYDRALGADEVRRNHELYVAKLAARPHLPHVEVEAKAVALSAIPTKRQMTPYRDALVVNEFEVTKVVGASKDWPTPLMVGQRIRVAQWGVVEDVRMELKDLKAGDGRRMVLEIYEKHPEKIEEIMTSNTLAIDADEPLFYEPRP